MFTSFQILSELYILGLYLSWIRETFESLDPGALSDPGALFASLDLQGLFLCLLIVDMTLSSRYAYTVDLFLF